MNSVTETANEAKRIQQTDVLRIRAAADIVSIISRYVPLKRSGQSVSYRGLCPFHQEKTPSFTVNPRKQFWHCFGCQAGGDVFHFVQRIEGCDFPRALAIVADLAGVPIDKRPPRQEQRNVRRDEARWRELCEHFRLRFGVTAELAPRYLKWSCQADPGFRQWLEEDMEHVHVLCAFAVSLLAKAQQRDGDFPNREEAA